LTNRNAKHVIRAVWVRAPAQGLSGKFVFRHAWRHCGTEGHPAVMMLFVTLQIDDQEGHLCEKGHLWNLCAGE
jgi:hypothetical protein